LAVNQKKYATQKKKASKYQPLPVGPKPEKFNCVWQIFHYKGFSASADSDIFFRPPHKMNRAAIENLLETAQAPW